MAQPQCLSPALAITAARRRRDAQYGCHARLRPARVFAHGRRYMNTLISDQKNRIYRDRRRCHLALGLPGEVVNA